ncbi:MAG TPA: hypothetical protein VI112_16335 [Bacteroidia bacterium]
MSGAKKETSGNTPGRIPAPGSFENIVEKIVYFLVILVAGLLACNGIIDKATAGIGSAIVLLHLFYRVRKRTV